MLCKLSYRICHQRNQIHRFAFVHNMLLYDEHVATRCAKVRPPHSKCLRASDIEVVTQTTWWVVQCRVVHIVSTRISPCRTHWQDIGHVVRATPAIAQLVEHLIVDLCSNQMVPGSIPCGCMRSY